VVPRAFGFALGAAFLVAIEACVPGELFLAAEGDAGPDAELDAGLDAHVGDREETADTSRPSDAADAAAPEAAPPDVMFIDTAHPDDTGHADAAPPPIPCADAGACAVPSDLCCFSPGGGVPPSACEPDTSASVKACASAGGTPISCDREEDCPGSVCCGTLITDDAGTNTGYFDVLCEVTCTGSSKVVFCAPASLPDECAPFGLKCAPSALLPGFNVCE